MGGGCVAGFVGLGEASAFFFAASCRDGSAWGVRTGVLAGALRSAARARGRGGSAFLRASSRSARSIAVSRPLASFLASSIPM